KAQGAQEYNAPNGGSLDTDSAKIGARRHLSMRSIRRALGVDASPARRCSAEAVAGRFQGCKSMISSLLLGRSVTQDRAGRWGSATLLVILGLTAMMPRGRRDRECGLSIPSP